MRVAASCEDDLMQVTMTINDVVIEDDDEIRLIVNDYLALGGDAILKPIMPEGGFAIDTNMPMTRDVFIDWVMNKGGTLHPDDYVSSDAPWTRTPWTQVSSSFIICVFLVEFTLKSYWPRILSTVL